MIKYFFTVVGVLLIHSFTLGQESTPIHLTNNSRPKLILRYSILDHYKFSYPAVQIGVEYKVNNFVGLNTEFGIMNENLNVFNITSGGGLYSRNRQISGYRAVGDIRFYPWNKIEYYANRIFVSFHFGYEESKVSHTDRFSRHDFLYIQELDYEINNKVNTYLVTMGLNFREDKNVYIDLVGGVGVKQIVSNTDLPEDAVRIRNGIQVLDSNLSGKILMPSIYFGVYLSWAAIK